MSRFVLLSITVSSLLSLVFCLLFGSLQVWISILCLTLGSLIAFFLRDRREDFQPLSWILFFTFGAFFWSALQWEDKQFFVQNINNFGDFSFHVHLIQYLARGAEFWPANPIFAGEPLRYPFGLHLYNAMLEQIGISFFWHMPLLAAVIFFVFCRVALAQIGVFATLAILLGGGVTLSSWGPASEVDWKNLLLSVMTTQRGALFALPVGIYLVAQVLSWRHSHSIDKKSFLAINVLLGGLAFFHLHSFVVIGMAVIVLLSARPRLLLRLVPAFLLGAAFCWKALAGGTALSSSLRWVPLWTWTDSQNIFEYLWRNFYLWPFVFFILGFLWIRPRSLYFILMLSTGLSLQVMLAPWAWDQIKILMWIYIFWLWALSSSWRNKSRVLKFALMLILLGPGARQVWLASRAQPTALLQRSHVEELQKAVQGIDVMSTFLTAPGYNHPIHWTGQRVFMGYEGHVWSQGINAADRAKSIDQIYRAQGEWLKQLRDWEVKYLFYGLEEQKRYGPLPVEIQQLPIVSQTAGGTIYGL